MGGNRKAYWVGAVFLCAAMAPAMDTTGYRYVRDIRCAGDREELAAVTLDHTMWDALQPGAADLRIVADDGRAVPYRLRKALRSERRTERIPCASHMTAFRQLPDNQAEFTLALATNAPAADEIVFDTPLKDFERQLSVWEMRPDGSEQLLVEDALIYDYSRFVDVRRVMVGLPGNDARRFRVRVEEVTDQAQSPRHQIERTMEGGAEVRTKDQSVVTTRPFRIDRVTFYHARKTEGPRAERRTDYAVKCWTVREDGRRKQTVIEIESCNEPLTSFVVEDDTRNFSRPAAVEVPGREGGIESWRRVGQARISRIAFRSFLREEMAVSFPEQASRRFRIVIDNQDGPAPSVTGIHGRGPVWQAVFMAEPGVGYAAYYGGSDTRAPRYDTDHLGVLLAKDYEPAEVGLGAPVTNTGFRSGGGGIGGVVGSRAFFVTVIVVMVGVLAFALVRAARKMGEGEDGDR